MMELIFSLYYLVYIFLPWEANLYPQDFLDSKHHIPLPLAMLSRTDGKIEIQNTHKALHIASLQRLAVVHPGLYSR